MSKRARLIQAIWIYSAVAVLIVVTLAPLVWLFLMSVSSTKDLTTVPLHWVPDQWDFSRYVRLLAGATGGEDNSVSAEFLSTLRNSIIAAGGSTAIAMVAAIPAAYAVSRYSGRMPVLYGMIGTYMMPPVTYVLPLYIAFAVMGLLNNVGALLVVYSTMLLPFTTWLLKSNFDAVPREIEEAARVDGCGRLSSVIRIILPISMPGILSVVIFAATLSIQEFLYALTFVSAADQKPVPLGVATDLVRGDIFYWGSLMAGALIVGVPVAILYNFFLDHFVTGITGGAMK